MRKALGTAVFSGMLGVTIFGIFFTASVFEFCFFHGFPDLIFGIFFMKSRHFSTQPSGRS